MLAQLFFIVGGIILSLISAFTGFYSFKQKNHSGVYLGRACIASIAVIVFYILSIMLPNKIAASIFTSLYVLGADVLIYLLYKMALYLVDNNNKMFFAFDIVFFALLFLDFAIFIINPFNEFVVVFTKNATSPYPVYLVDFKPPYYFHVAFNALMVVIIISIYIFKAVQSSKAYRILIFIWL